MNKKEISKLYSLLNKKILSTLDKYNISKLPERKKIKILNKTIKDSINSTFKNFSSKLKANLYEIADINYLLTLYASEKKSKINIGSKIINKVNNLVKKIVDRSVAGKTINQRLVKNNKKLLKDSLKIIKIELKKNTPIKDIAKQLQLKLNIDKNRAIKIARTETHRIREESTQAAFDEAEKVGIEFKRKWLSTLDSRTRDTHQKLDGKYADEEGYYYSSGGKTKYPGGFGIAKEDIHCRCTQIQEFKKISGKNTRYVQEDNEYIDYKTFDEWRNK